MGLGKLVELRVAVESFVADIEADHGQRPASLKNNLRGFRVVEDVGFGGGVDVAARN